MQAARAPEFDRASFRAEVQGNTAVLQIQWEPACRIREQETREVDRETIRLAHPVVVTTEILVGTVGGIALADKGFSEGMPVVGWTGIALFALGIAAPIIDAEAARDSTARLRITDRVSPERVDHCGSPRLELVLVSLVMPGTTLTAFPNAEGVVRFTIDDSAWNRAGGAMDAEVRIDGQSIGRTRLVRIGQ